MTKTIVILALLLTGCAKRYQVCISTDQGVGCMHHDLAKADAVSVGRGIAALGYDVIVKPKGVEDLPAAVSNGSGDGDIQAAPVTPHQSDPAPESVPL